MPSQSAMTPTTSVTAAPALSEVEGPECRPLQAPGDVITVCPVVAGNCTYTNVQAAPVAPPPAPDHTRVVIAQQSTPVMFIENVGQFDYGPRPTPDISPEDLGTLAPVTGPTAENLPPVDVVTVTDCRPAGGNRLMRRNGIAWSPYEQLGSSPAHVAAPAIPPPPNGGVGVPSPPRPHTGCGIQSIEDPVPATGNQKLLVILVDFPDKPGIFTGQEWWQFFFGAAGFADYFEEVSYNQLHFTGDMVGLSGGTPVVNSDGVAYVRLPNPITFYANGSAGKGDTFPAPELWGMLGYLDSGPDVGRRLYPQLPLVGRQRQSTSRDRSG